MTKVNWNRLSVLIVDDDAPIRELLSTYLYQFGVLDVALAENGREALDRLKAAPRLPDLIVCDMQMPVMNGLEFTANLRAAEYKAVSSIPIMVCTTMSRQDVVDEALRLGVNGFIVKPIDPKSMFKRIETVLNDVQQNSASVSRARETLAPVRRKV